MSNSVEDAFLMLEAMSDFKRKDVRRARILIPKNYFFDGVDAEVIGLVRSAAEHLGPVEEVEIPMALKAWETNPVLLLSEAVAVHEERLLGHPERFGPGIADRFQGGFAYRGIDFARALAFRDEWRAFLQRLLAMPPAVLVVPGTPVPATLIGDREGAPIARIMTRFTSPFNLAGVPVLSIPVGKVGGLPVGMQLVAPAFGESLLWAVSREA
jgi:aspartyl-tRNA(Asn)/glutamyl-tRNA(Gln) amidotransferase subunit A